MYHVEYLSVVEYKNDSSIRYVNFLPYVRNVQCITRITAYMLFTAGELVFSPKFFPSAKLNSVGI